MTDFVISTNLIVFGMSTFTGGQTFDGQMIVDLTSAEALLVRKDGDTEDVFIVDTTNEAVRLASDDTFLAFGAASDAQMHRGDAADIIEQRRGANPQWWRLYDRFVSHSDYDRLTIYIGGGPPLKTIEFEAESSNASQGISINIEALPGGSSDGRLNLMNGATNLLQLAPTSTALNTPLAITTTGTSSLTLNGFLSTLGAAVPTSGIGIKMDIAGQGASDFEDSHKFDIIGAGENANRATWRTFVDVIDVGANSIWTLQDDKNGGGFVTNFSITDDGGFNFPLPLPSHAIGGAIDTQYQLLLDGDYFSLLGGDLVAAKLKIENRITGPSGATTGLFGVSIGTNIRTQTATESITNIAQVRIDEPNITDNLTGSITNAQSLLISGSPTEGTNNFAIRSAGAAASMFQGAQFVIGHFTLFDYNQVLISGGFTSGGGSDRATKFKVEGVLTSAPGDTGTINGAWFGATVTTQTATENIADISQVRIDRPIITDNLTGDVTKAHTLFLTGSPTEGELNYSLRSVGGAPSIFQGPQFVIGDFVEDDFWQVLISGSFTSGGSSNESAKLRIEGALTGASGDTAGMVGTYFDATFVTQTETENIANISQCRFDGANITDNLTGDITHAQTLFITASPTAGEANWTIRSTALAPCIFQGQQFVIGATSVFDYQQVTIAGGFVSGGGAAQADKLRIMDSLTGASGDIILNGAFFSCSITTQTAAEVLTDVAQVRINEPGITLGGGSSITNAQSLLISGAPTEGVNNYALRVITGNVFFGGAQAIFGDGTAALPGIRFEADTDTGFYMNASNDSLLVTVNSNSIIRWDRGSGIPRMNLSNDCVLTWLSGAAHGGGVQFGLGREAADAGSAPGGDLFLANTNFSVYQDKVATTDYHRTSIRTATETLSSVTGASVATASIIPAGALVLGVTTDVDVALGVTGGTTGYNVGDGSDVDRWGAITGTSVSTFSDDADFTTTTIDRFSAAGAVTITAVGGNFDGTGDIVVVVHYMEIGARKP